MNAHEWMAALAPAGPQAAHVARLFWLFFAVTGVVFVLVLVGLALALVRGRGAAGDGPINPDARAEQGPTRIVATCVGISIAILFALLVSSVTTGRALASLRTDSAPTITLVGHQWWWEVIYEDAIPARRVVTANELHLPTGVPVAINAMSRDVIHSFWVPPLHGKRDLIPDYTSTIWLQADRPGTYHGQCAEFCGRQHAKMAMDVVAQAPPDFSAWLEHERAAATPPASAIAERGRELFMRGTCSGCHSVRGTSAQGLVGPDLTHVGRRMRIAAGTLDNRPDVLEQWIANSQAAKPGNRMPPHRLAAADLEAITAYVGGLQ
jgi:cytochrome c oxidase subunit 2